ncbi:MAG: pyrroloquinoline quinone biosynthesis peptide chaperone PqqD [Azospira sp.]|jgi:pyrroloquinoline quinone biosynthesis protein D|nr:pyrroloquinoline quinone biosynthesis peptide chaperone PqqD [Azospira sp.]
MDSANFRPRLDPRFVFRWEPSQEAFILLYPEGLIKLNPSAGEILSRCDGLRSVDEIAAELAVVFAGDAAEVAAGTRGFIALAHEKGWLRPAA